MTLRNYCIEAEDPGKFMFDRLMYGDKHAATHNECTVRVMNMEGEGEPSDDFFDMSEPYVCEKKEYAPRKMTLREKILFGK